MVFYLLPDIVLLGEMRSFLGLGGPGGVLAFSSHNRRLSLQPWAAGGWGIPPRAPHPPVRNRPLARVVQGLDGYRRGKRLRPGGGGEWVSEPSYLIGGLGDVKELQDLICPQKERTALGKHKATEVLHWISLGFNPKLTLL